MSHVFISYAHTDQDFVQEHLIPWLNANGYDAWVDSEKLRAGENWIEEIDNAIKASYALIVVISPASMTSPYVTYEWAFALGCDIPVIPVKYSVPHRQDHEMAKLSSFSGCRCWFGIDDPK